jgi:hypothetical protein
MADSRTQFDARLRALGRKHRALAKGSTMKLRRDGLIVVRPTRRSMWTLFPVRGLAVALIVLFAVKGGLLVAYDSAEYDARLATLSAGTAVEQIGAVLMQPDRVSQMFAEAYIAAYQFASK